VKTSALHEQKKISFILSVFLYKFSNHFPYWLFMYNRGTVMKTPSPAPRFRKYTKYKLYKAERSDFDDISSLTNLPITELQRRFGIGDWAYIVRDISDNRLVSVLWLHQGKCFIRGFGLLLNLNSNDAYLYGGFSEPEVRMKGLIDTSIHDVCEILKDAGVINYFVLIEEWNKYSYNYHARLGFNPIIKATFIKIACFKICILFDTDTRKRSFVVFLNQPDDIVYI
jgi:hypothetical protein